MSLNLKLEPGYAIHIFGGLSKKVDIIQQSKQLLSAVVTTTPLLLSYLTQTGFDRRENK